MQDSVSKLVQSCLIVVLDTVRIYIYILFVVLFLACRMKRAVFVIVLLRFCLQIISVSIGWPFVNVKGPNENFDILYSISNLFLKSSNF